MQDNPLKSLKNTSFVTTHDESFHFENYAGHPFVIFFYPKDNTPGCSQEAQDFRDFYASFQQLNCPIIGVSRDTLKSHQKFTEKFTLPYPLLADTEEVLCQAFQCIKDKTMFGKKVRGIVRSTYLFDASGNLVKEWIKVKIPGHAEEVLNTVSEMVA